MYFYFLFFFFFIYPAHHTPSQIIEERERCAALHLDPLGGHSQVIAYTATLRVWYGRKTKQKTTANPIAFCDWQTMISSYETVCGLFSPAFVALCLCVNKCINPWQPGEAVLFALLLRKTVFDPCSNFLFKTTPSSQQPSLQAKVNTRLGNGLISCCRPRRRDGLLGTGTEWEGDERVKGSTAETARKRPERPWTAARTMEVLRWCPLAVAQRLVHCAINALSTAVLDSH